MKQKSNTRPGEVCNLDGSIESISGLMWRWTQSTTTAYILDEKKNDCEVGEAEMPHDAASGMKVQDITVSRPLRTALYMRHPLTRQQAQGHNSNIAVDNDLPLNAPVQPLEASLPSTTRAKPKANAPADTEPSKKRVRIDLAETGNGVGKDNNEPDDDVVDLAVPKRKLTTTWHGRSRSASDAAPKQPYCRPQSQGCRV